MSCEPCAYARREGWWGDSIPPNATHCRACHATYPGSQRWGHCARCHHTFSGVTAFDRHQSAEKGELSICDVLHDKDEDPDISPLSFMKKEWGEYVGHPVDESVFEKAFGRKTEGPHE